MVKQLRFIAKAEGHICINRYIDEDKIRIYIDKTKSHGHKYAVVDGNHNLVEGDLRTMQQGLSMSKL